MIYTTYFANLKRLPENVVPISICGKAPDSYTGLQYKKLAPKWDFFQQWKQTHDNKYYEDKFRELVLDELDPKEVFTELSLMAGSYDIALVCYEKPEDFCHRHLVRNWFMVAGYQTKELYNGKP